MADITAIVNTNTFDEQMSTINEIITKLNTIEANASTMLLAFSSTVPLDAAVATNTAMLFVDSSGNFKLKKIFPSFTKGINRTTAPPSIL